MSGEDAITLVREYEDIQYLDHQLHVFNKHPGIIFPPLPDKPSTDAAGAENSSRKQLGTRFLYYREREFNMSQSKVKNVCHLRITTVFQETFDLKSENIGLLKKLSLLQSSLLLHK